MRRGLFEIYGDHEDKYWFKDLEARIDEEKRELILEAEHQFLSEYIVKNYQTAIAEVSRKLGFTLVCVVAKGKNRKPS